MFYRFRYTCQIIFILIDIRHKVEDLVDLDDEARVEIVVRKSVRELVTFAETRRFKFARILEKVSNKFFQVSAVYIPPSPEFFCHRLYDSPYRPFDQQTTFDHSLYCVLILTSDLTQESAPILAGKHSSQMHICATEYWQLITTCRLLTCLKPAHLYNKISAVSYNMYKH